MTSTRTRAPLTMTCRHCQRRWTALGAAHCTACHRHFSAVTLFARHRVNYECVDPATIHTKDGRPVMELTTDGVWTTWTDPTAPRPEFWALP